MKKKHLFKVLAKINKLILPSLSKRRVNVYKLNKRQKLLLGYRYWVTKNSLD
jgi:phage gp16-like protein